MSPDPATGSTAGPPPPAARTDEAPYAPARAPGVITLHLDANEGPTPLVDPVAVVGSLGPEAARRYPSADALEAKIADRLGVAAGRVLVTAGGDEAIDRACRAFLSPDRRLILPTPTFEMIGRYARLAGAEPAAAPWPGGPYPTRAVLDLLDARTAMIAVVSPNNPTGAAARAADLRTLSEAASGAVLLVDLAYTEFADEDLTQEALDLPNTIVIRTFSKAFGLAGIRVGYAVASPDAARAMRAVAGPFPVSGLSLAVAGAALDAPPARLAEVVGRVREERTRLAALLRELGGLPRESQANFVLAEFANAGAVWRGLGVRGIAVRRFEPRTGLGGALRITCPGESGRFERLCGALREVLSGRRP